MWSHADGCPLEDFLLKPVAVYRDPFRRGQHRLVLCELLNKHWEPASKCELLETLWTSEPASMCELLDKDWEPASMCELLDKDWESDSKCDFIKLRLETS